MGRNLFRSAKLLQAGLLMLAATAMLACAPSQTKPVLGEAATPVSTASGLISGPGIDPAEVASCTARGGGLQRVCRMGNVSCVTTYADANKACTDGSQCQSGHCLTEYNATNDPKAAVRGVCKATNDPCGCFTYMDKGKPGATLCVD